MQIGSRRVLFTNTFIIPDGDSATFQIIDPPHAPLAYRIFATSQKSPREWPIYWEPAPGNIVELHFCEMPETWASTGPYVPFTTGTQGQIYFSAFYYRVLKNCIITITFTVG